MSPTSFSDFDRHQGRHSTKMTAHLLRRLANQNAAAIESSAPSAPAEVAKEVPRPVHELNSEQNPFEKSFSHNGPSGAGPGGQTPNSTKLPSVSVLASPSAAGIARSPFGWKNSLKSGPLSPALLSGPLANSGGDYFADRGGFHESSLRTGLTPGPSSNTMFAPSQSPSLFPTFPGGASTPTTADFHRTALSAATKQREQQSKLRHLVVTSEPRDGTSSTSTSAAPATSGPSPVDVKPNFDTHNDAHASEAVNGLFMLAQQGRTSGPPGQQFPPPSQPSAPAMNSLPPMSGNAPQNSTRPSPPQPQPTIVTANGRSALPAQPTRPDSSPESKKGGKRTGGTRTISVKRKNDSTSEKNSKKLKSDMQSMEMDDADEDEYGEDGRKMTEDEKRKNFLERNRIAALKCRQRKKQWLSELQSRVDTLTSENEDLNQQLTRLRTDMVNLKTLLLAHKDCPVTLEQVVRGQYPPNGGADDFNSQMNPYPNNAIAPSGNHSRRMTTSQPIPLGQGGGRIAYP